jgi:hypothetical protein
MHGVGFLRSLQPNSYMPMHQYCTASANIKETIALDQGSLKAVLAQKLFIDCHPIDALLRKLECGKENSIYNARSAHRHAEAWGNGQCMGGRG